MNTVAASPESHRLARRILFAAVAVQLLFFWIATKQCVRDACTEPTKARVIGASILGIDSHGYYAWLRSLMVDGDWNFDNEFGYYNQITPTPEPYSGRTPIGRHISHWSVGPAMIWSAGVVPVHAALGVLGLRGAGIENGYTPPYQLAIACVTLALGIITLLLTYSITRRFASPVPAAIATAGMILGTTVLAYQTIIPGMAHGPSTAMLTTFVFCWVRSLGSARVLRWFGLGVLLGVACLVRWQLATFSVLLFLEAVWLASTVPMNARWRWAGLLALAGIGSVVGFIPQMVAWQCVFGSPLVSTHAITLDGLLNPSLWRILGSYDRSFFYWTPITLVAVLACGYALSRSSTRSPQLAMLTASGAIQIYVVAAVMGPLVFLGSSFGVRFLSETCIVLAPGLAVMLASVNPRVARTVALGICLLVGWNLLMINGTRALCVVNEGPATPTELVSQVAKGCGRRPFEAVVALAFTGWFAAAVWSGLRRKQTTTETIPLPDLSEKPLAA